MLKLENFFDFMEESFDYLLVLDGDGTIIHASEEIVSDSFPDNGSLDGRSIDDLLTVSSLETVRSAMVQAKAGTRGVVVISTDDDGSTNIPLKMGHFVAEKGDVYPIFGNRLEGLVKEDGWEKDERIKELSCLYTVAELIEVSSSIPDFFTRLPKTLGQGMVYPEEVVIYSQYTGIEYGQKPTSKKQLRVPLIVSKEEKGEILADSEPGSETEVTRHDGARIRLRKLDESYDPTDSAVCLATLERSRRKGEVATGLLYLDAEERDLHQLIGTTAQPLNAVPAGDLCPGSAALDAINASKR